MTYSEASTIVRSQFDKSVTQISRIDWTKVRGFLYNVAVAVGVALYLCYLAAKVVVKATRIAYSLWVKYEVIAKIESAITTLRSGVPTLLTESRKQVEKVYTNFGDRVQQIAISMAKDYRSIRSEVRAITED